MKILNSADCSGPYAPARLRDIADASVRPSSASCTRYVSAATAGRRAAAVAFSGGDPVRRRRLALFGLGGPVLEVGVERLDGAPAADVDLVREAAEGVALQVRQGGLAQPAELFAVEDVEVAAQPGQPLLGQQDGLGLIERPEQAVGGQRAVRRPVAGAERAGEVHLGERLGYQHPPVRVRPVQDRQVTGEQWISGEGENAR